MESNLRAIENAWHEPGFRSMVETGNVKTEFVGELHISMFLVPSTRIKSITYPHNVIQIHGFVAVV